jgi:hypothetical protein
MHFFKKFVDLSSWLVMQYKVSLTISIWSPTKGPPIQLWKANVDGSPKLPTRVPNFGPYHPIWGHDAITCVEKEKFINVGLSKYVEF